jgi:hypothetical protein
MFKQKTTSILLFIVGLFLLPMVSWAGLNTDVSISAIVTNSSTPVDNPTSPVGGGITSPSTDFVTVPTSVTFSGSAFPSATIILLLDGTEVSRGVANPDSLFSLKLSPVSSGVKNFSILAENEKGQRSSLLSIPITISDNTSTNIAKLVIPPIPIPVLISPTTPKNDTTIQSQKPAPFVADINDDQVVDIKDFSILAFWYKKPNPPKNVDLNGDGKVDIVDFSILAYSWNG